MVAAVSTSGSFASLKAETSDRKTSNESHNALLNIPADSDQNKSPTPETKRKGSWTDIFFPGRSRSKSTSSSPRKSPTVPTERKRSVFTKFINFGKKSPTKDMSSPDANSQEVSAVESSDTPRVSVTDTSENEPHEELMINSPTNEPKASEQDILGILEAAHSQMDRTPVEEEIQAIPVPLPPLNLRKKLKRRESTVDDDVQSLPEVLPSSRSRELSQMHTNVEPNEVHTESVVVQIESYIDRGDNSSESEVGIDETRLKTKKTVGPDGKSVSESEDDFEAQNLLTQDSIDYDESSFTESVMVTMAQSMSLQSPPETVKSPTRKDRLEVQTIPIDRPRSTTPINIVPLEAYIRSSSISPDPNVEKIKLSLPGEQFTASARAKSPRKSNPSIWFEFCEKGLQSPLQRRKQRANSCFTTSDSQQNPFPISPVDAFANPALTPSPGNLTPVTPLEGFADSKWPGFGDNFVNFGAIMSSNGINEANDKFMCNCECNANKTSANTGLDPSADSSSPTHESNNTNNNNNLVRDPDHQYMEDQPLVSPCDCQCHRRADFALTLWKSSSFNKQESISSDISSASSRLIGSSSSNSKCSPSEDINESMDS